MSFKLNCLKAGHEDQHIFGTCVQSTCPSQGLVCFKCLLSFHSTHIASCIPLNDFLKLVRENVNDLLLNSLGSTSSSQSNDSQLQKMVSELASIKEVIVKLKHQLEKELPLYINTITDDIDSQMDILKNNSTVSPLATLQGFVDQLQVCEEMNYEELNSVAGYFSRFVEKTEEKKDPEFKHKQLYVDKSINAKETKNLNILCQQAEQALINLSAFIDTLKELEVDSASHSVEKEQQAFSDYLNNSEQSTNNSSFSNISSLSPISSNKTILPSLSVPVPPFNIGAPGNHFNSGNNNFYNNNNSNNTNSNFGNSNSNSNNFAPNSNKIQYHGGENQNIHNNSNGIHPSNNYSMSNQISNINPINLNIQQSPNGQNKRQGNNNINNVNSNQRHSKPMGNSQQQPRPKQDHPTQSRLNIRSLEHFCDALEVKHHNVWGLSFKIYHESTYLSGFNHLPIFNYSNTFSSSLKKAEIQIQIIQGHKRGQYQKIYSSKHTFTKTNKESDDENHTERVNLFTNVRLHKNVPYSILILNITEAQVEDSSNRLFFCYGDISQQINEVNEAGCQFIDCDLQGLKESAFPQGTIFNNSIVEADENSNSDHFIQSLNLLVPVNSNPKTQQNSNTITSTSSLQPELAVSNSDFRLQEGDMINQASQQLLSINQLLQSNHHTSTDMNTTSNGSEQYGMNNNNNNNNGYQNNFARYNNVGNQENSHGAGGHKQHQNNQGYSYNNNNNINSNGINNNNNQNYQYNNQKRKYNNNVQQQHQYNGNNGSVEQNQYMNHGLQNNNSAQYSQNHSSSMNSGNNNGMGTGNLYQQYKGNDNRPYNNSYNNISMGTNLNK